MGVIFFASTVAGIRQNSYIINKPVKHC